MKNPLDTWKGAVTLGVLLTVVLWLIAGAMF
jgi:hypothetical protein